MEPEDGPLNKLKDYIPLQPHGFQVPGELLDEFSCIVLYSGTLAQIVRKQTHGHLLEANTHKLPFPPSPASKSSGAMRFAATRALVGSRVSSLAR